MKGRHLASSFSAATTGLPALVAALVWLLSAAGAGAAEPSISRGASADAPGDSPCGSGYWRLEGAPLTFDEGAAYSDAWTPDLERAARCAKPSLTLCLEVQGHFDKVSFSDATLKAFGSVAAAQQARARGRSASVTAKLRELGVAETQIKESIPLAAPTFRGATVSLRNGCVSPVVEAAQIEAMVRGVAGEMLRADSGVVSEAVASQIERLKASQPSPQPATSHAPEVEVPHVWWGEAGIDASLLGFPSSEEKRRDLSALARLGLGWSRRTLYVRGHGGLLAGSAAEQRLGAELALAAGYRRDDWAVGIRGTGRLTSPGLGDPWLDQSLDLGVEATRCFWSFGQWQGCAYGLVSPLSRHWRRGEINGGQIERIPTLSSYMFRADLGVSVRFSPNL
jgi:hypothetical protein